MTDASTVSVIGLGTMGVTLARLLLSKGHEVTVWNRTRGKGDALVQSGAVEAASAAAAVAASDIVVVCVYDYQGRQRDSRHARDRGGAGRPRARAADDR